MSQRTEIGWQSMSAAGGGGGMLRAFADPTPLAEAIAAETTRRGEPESQHAGGATWTSGSGGSHDRVELYAPDHPPGHAPIDRPIPPGTGHIRVEVSVYAPAPGPDFDRPLDDTVQVRTRWILAIVLLGALAAAAAFALW